MTFRPTGPSKAPRPAHLASHSIPACRSSRPPQGRHAAGMMRRCQRRSREAGIDRKRPKTTNGDLQAKTALSATGLGARCGGLKGGPRPPGGRTFARTDGAPSRGRGSRRWDTHRQDPVRTTVRYRAQHLATGCARSNMDLSNHPAGPRGLTRHDRPCITPGADTRHLGAAAAGGLAPGQISGKMVSASILAATPPSAAHPGYPTYRVTRLSHPE
jgi:hypothetical protein